MEDVWDENHALGHSAAAIQEKGQSLRIRRGRRFSGNGASGNGGVDTDLFRAGGRDSAPSRGTRRAPRAGTASQRGDPDHAKGLRGHQEIRQQGSRTHPRGSPAQGRKTPRSS